MLSADLSGMVLDLAQWGASDPGKLAFLDPPPSGALTEARALLTELGAIDAARRITDEGRKLRRLPLPPRLARMVVDAAAVGAGGRRMAKRWADDAGASVEKSDLSAGAILSLAYPERIAKSRGANGMFLLANGRGANVD